MVLANYVACTYRLIWSFPSFLLQHVIGISLNTFSSCPQRDAAGTGKCCVWLRGLFFQSNVLKGRYRKSKQYLLQNGKCRHAVLVHCCAGVPVPVILIGNISSMLSTQITCSLKPYHGGLLTGTKTRLRKGLTLFQLKSSLLY